MGLNDGLVTLVLANGSSMTIGKPVGRVSSTVPFAELVQDLRSGKVPQALVNSALPVFSGDGNIWVVGQMTGVVELYQTSGERMASFRVTEPDFPIIRKEMAEANVDAPPLVIKWFILDAAAVGKDLWLLMASPAHGSAKVVVVSPPRGVVGRLIFPEVRGADKLAVDDKRGRIFLSIGDRAEIVRAAVPVQLGH